MHKKLIKKIMDYLSKLSVDQEDVVGVDITPSCIRLAQLSGGDDKWILTKLGYKYIEDAKVSIRNIRRDSNEQLKDFEKNKDLSEDNLKRALDNIQDLTDDYIKKLIEMQELKEKDILL